VADHNIDLDHHMLLNNTSILAKKSRCRIQLITEVIEIKQYPTNMNREYGLSLSIFWKSLVYSLK
jgi:hypothetical protein